MRDAGFFIGAIIVLAGLNGLVIHKELILRAGTPVFLKLAPADPRSLIQGDYMRLAYEITRGPLAAEAMRENRRGAIVIRLDSRGVGQFVRIHHGEPLGENELLLRYKRRGTVSLGAESFFFQEGHAKYYERARYGELRVAPSGHSVLVGLRGEKLEPLGPPGGEPK